MGGGCTLRAARPDFETGGGTGGMTTGLPQTGQFSRTAVRDGRAVTSWPAGQRNVRDTRVNNSRFRALEY